MKENTRNFITGIVSIIAFAGLAFLLLLFGDLDALSRRTYAITVEANDSNGLRTGSQVTLVGVPIGEIDRVAIRIDQKLPVKLTAVIDAGVDLPAGVHASVSTSLIGGTARLDLAVPADYKAGGPTLPRDGTALVQANFERIEDKFLRAFNEKFGGVEAALQSITAAAQEARKWLSDDQLLADAKSAVWKANTLIDQATTTMISFADAAKGIQGDSKSLVASVQPVCDQLSKTLEQIEALTKQATSGTGTVGQLMSNPDLYKALVDSAVRLKATLSEIEALMQKIRAEGLGVEF